MSEDNGPEKLIVSKQDGLLRLIVLLQIMI